MSKSALSKYIAKNISKYYKEMEQRRKRGLLNLRITSLEISAKGIRKGTRLRVRRGETKYKNPIITKKEYRLTSKQAQLLARALWNFFTKNVSASGSSETFEEFNFDKHIRFNGSEPYTEPELLKPVYIKYGAFGILFTRTYGMMDSRLREFSHVFQKFLEGEDNSFFGIKRSTFLSIGGEKYIDLFTEVGGRRRIIKEVDGETKVSTRRSLELGHMASTVDPERMSVSEAQLTYAIDSIEGIHSGIKQKLKRNMEEKFHKAQDDFSVTFDKTPYNRFLGVFTFIKTGIQHSATNQSIGTDEKYFKNLFTDPNYIHKLLHLEGSPSIIQNSLDRVIHFFGKKLKEIESKYVHTHINNKVKKPKNTKTSVNIKHDAIKPKVDELFKNARTSTPSFDIEIGLPEYHTTCGLTLDRLLQYKGLLNYNLHDQLYNIMGHEPASRFGKAGQKEILNYDTGRFARSAEITDLTIDRDTCELNADFTYQRDPYDIFSPSGKLYKPGRDPERLIGTAIRNEAKNIMRNRFAIRTRLI